jgi:hypothetical protein
MSKPASQTHTEHQVTIRSYGQDNRIEKEETTTTVTDGFIAAESEGGEDVAKMSGDGCYAEPSPVAELRGSTTVIREIDLGEAGNLVIALVSR